MPAIMLSMHLNSHIFIHSSSHRRFMWQPCHLAFLCFIVHDFRQSCRFLVLWWLVGVFLSWCLLIAPQLYLICVRNCGLVIVQDLFRPSSNHHYPSMPAPLTCTLRGHSFSFSSGSLCRYLYCMLLFCQLGFVSTFCHCEACEYFLWISLVPILTISSCCPLIVVQIRLVLVTFFPGRLLPSRQEIALSSHCQFLLLILYQLPTFVTSFPVFHLGHGQG